MPKEQSQNDNPEKLATHEKQENKNTTQYVLDTTLSCSRIIQVVKL